MLILCKLNNKKELKTFKNKIIDVVIVST